MINNNCITVRFIEMIHQNPRHELVHLPLGRAVDTPLHIQEDVITTDTTVSETLKRQEYVAQNHTQIITY